MELQGSHRASPATRSAYIPGIDGLRAIAVVSVMTFHLMPAALPGGYIGVDIFFVISGFVVTGSLMRDAGLPFRHFVAAFYARRFRRIVPALSVCLVVTVVVSVAFIPEAWLSASLRSTALQAFFGFSNFALVETDDGYFAPRSEFNPFTHTWSLAVEEQFYLIFPILLYQIVSRPRQRAAAVLRWVFVALCVTSLAWSARTTQAAPNEAYYMIASRFWELGAGSAIAVFSSQASRIGDVIRLRYLLLGGVALIGVSLAVADRSAFPFPWALPAVFGSVLLIVALAERPSDDPVTRFLSSRPMVSIGVLSYSLYLWHWPVNTLLRWTVGVGSVAATIAALSVTVAAAWLSYRWIERPGQLHRWVQRLPAWGTITCGAALLALGWAVSSKIYERPWVVSQSVVTRHRSEWYPEPPRSMDAAQVPEGDCIVRNEFRRRDAVDIVTFTPADCAKDLARVRRHLFVMGDSHTGAYVRLLYRVAAATGVSVVAHSRAGCGVGNLARPPSAGISGCESHSERVLKSFVGQAQPGDIVWLASLDVPRLGDQDGPFPAERVRESRHGAKAIADRAAAEIEAVRVIERLIRADLHVVIEAPKPIFPSSPFRCTDWFNRMNPSCVAGLSVSRAELEAHRAPVMDAIRRLTDRFPEVSVWDPFPVLCPRATCSAFDGAAPLFFDGDHLSGHGNDVLAPHFVRFLEHRVLGVGSAPAP